MGLRLEIGDLVVHGVSGNDSERLVAVIERELRSMIAAGGKVGGLAGGELADVVVEIPAGLETGEVGKRVARSIWDTCRGTGAPSALAAVLEAPTTDPPDPGGQERVE